VSVPDPVFLHPTDHVLEQRLQLADTLARITERINAGLALDEVLDLAYASLRSLIPYDRIGVALLSGGVVRTRWARAEVAEIHLDVGYSGRLAGSSLERIIETGQPRILGDLVAYLVTHPGSDSTRRMVAEGMRSSLTCPLMARGRPIGFLFFSSCRQGTYRDVHVETFQRIAGQLSLIIDKALAYEELVELDRARSRFLGAVAHDLRGPLTVVRGLVDLLARGSLDEASRRQVMERIRARCDDLVDQAESLLDVGSIEAGHLELDEVEVDLEAYLGERRMSDQLLASRKAIAVGYELPGDLPRVRLDPRRIDQVLDNLVGNAVKFSEPGASITVRASVDGQEVTLEVVDRGPGIPADELEGVFEPFARASTRPTGGERSTGLGLAIARRIVSAHGGRIGIHSQVGSGTTAWFTLPHRPGG